LSRPSRLLKQRPPEQDARVKPARDESPARAPHRRLRRWKEHDEYQKSFARVLRALTVKKP
jgi:hypothetical protein